MAAQRFVAVVGARVLPEAWAGAWVPGYQAEAPARTTALGRIFRVP